MVIARVAGRDTRVAGHTAEGGEVVTTQVEEVRGGTQPREK